MMKARIFIMTAFAALMIGTISVSAEDAHEVTEPVVTTAETTTVTTVTAVSETTTVTTAPPNILLGDANGDGVMNVRDCALIARKLAEDRADELSPETADYNKDSIINVRDAALIAHDLNLNFTRSANAPNKADYDLNNIAEMKRYINDTVIRKATEKYGITDIMADDNVKSNTWYAPTILLTDMEYYLTVTSVDEFGIEGCLPESYVLNADAAIADLMNAFEFIGQRTTPDGSAVDISKKRIRIKWTQIGDSNNFEIYVCYGGDY